MPADLRADAVRARDIPLRIYVHLTESYSTQLALRRRQLLEDGTYDFARPAPRGVEVDDGVGGAGGDGSEVLSGVYWDDLGRHGECWIVSVGVTRCVWLGGWEGWCKNAGGSEVGM